MTETETLRDRLAAHSVIGADLPRQGAGQTIPELMILCFTCGWMRASEYHDHLLPVVEREIAAARGEGATGPFPCCPHCADDAVHDVPKNGHEVRCDICEAKTHAYERGRAEGRAEVAAKVEAALGSALRRYFGCEGDCDHDGCDDCRTILADYRAALGGTDAGTGAGA